MLPPRVALKPHLRQALALAPQPASLLRLLSRASTTCRHAQSTPRQAPEERAVRGLSAAREARRRRAGARRVGGLHMASIWTQNGIHWLPLPQRWRAQGSRPLLTRMSTRCPSNAKNR